jgi:site-specific DNA recombinase
MITATETKKVLGIYTRVSTQGQADHGFSLEAQKKEGIKKAKQLGMEYKIYTDEGISAKDDDISGRPALNDLLNACELKEVHSVFCTEQDRLSRSPLAMAYIKVSFIKHNILLYTISSVIDFKDTEQEFMSDLMALLAKRENTLKSIRSKRGAREAAKQGKWIGVVLPYGYRLDENKLLTPDEEESKVVKDIYNWSLEGNGTNAIAARLNKLGIETRGRKAYKTGTKAVNKYTGEKREIPKESFIFKPGTVYGILTNTIYKGDRNYKGEVFKAPVIIDSEMWHRVNANLKANKHYSSNHNKHPYLLKGLIRCGCCGRNMYGKYKAKSGDNYYLCSSKREKGQFCGTRSISIPRIENLIWDQIINTDVHFRHLIKSIKGDSNKRRREELRELEQLKKQLKFLEKNEEELLDLYHTAGLSKELFTKRNEARIKEHAQVLERIVKIENREEQNAYIDKKLNEHIDMITAVKLDLDNLDFEERRTVVRELVYEIEVKYNEKGRCHYIETYYKVGNDTYVCRAVLSATTRSNHEDYIHHDDLTPNSFDRNVKDIRTKKIPVIAQRQKSYDAEHETVALKSIRYSCLFFLPQNEFWLFRAPRR